MTGLVERLRKWDRALQPVPPEKMLKEAADEIEHLDRLITLKNRQLREYQDENAKLQAVVDAARKEHFEIKGLIGIERDSIADIVSETNMRCLEVSVDATDKALAALKEADDD